jgi:DNA-binding transcriptional MocR family regulator
VLIDPGDVILVELPTYTGAIAAFRNAQADLVGVPQRPMASASRRSTRPGRA